MGLSDWLNGLTKKTQAAAVEHEEQLHEAVQKAEVAADQRTGGQYHDQIQKAGAKADAYLDSIKDPAAPAGEKTPPREEGKSTQ